MSSALGKQTPPDDEWDDLDTHDLDTQEFEAQEEAEDPEEAEEPAFVLQTRDLVLEKGNIPENFQAGKGLTLLNTRRESSSTLLSLALAGRHRQHAGEIEIAGRTSVRDRFKITALAGVPEIERIDRLVPAREVVREQVAWASPFFSITPRKQENLKQHDLVAPWLAPLELEELDLDQKVGELHVLDRFRIRVLLALISRPEAELLIVDDIDQIKQMELRQILLEELREVARDVPVLVNTVNDLSDFEADAVIEPQAEETLEETPEEDTMEDEL